MIRTIASSFVFLYPIHKSLEYQDYSILYLCILAIPISVANHAHTWHPDTFRRKLFMTIDISYMLFLMFYMLYPCFINTICILMVGLQISVLSFLYMYLLSDVKTIEDYKEWQKWVHVVFHISGVIGISKIREYCNPTWGIECYSWQTSNNKVLIDYCENSKVPSDLSIL